MTQTKPFGNISKLTRIKEYWKGKERVSASIGHVQDVRWLIERAHVAEELKAENAKLKKKLEHWQKPF